ncbi:MAG: LytR/AlgR family response regulator transcription factor [Rubrivivax sp.]
MRPTATVLIADDEEAPRAQLAQALAQAWPEARLVATSVNGVDAWDAFLEHEPEVCLLDIRMPGLTGIEVAQRIDGRAHIVFVTAYSDHALAAFDAGAVDYVLKPVEAPRLAQALARVQGRLQSDAAPGSAPSGSGAGKGVPAGLGTTVSTGADPAALQALLAQLAAQVQRPAPLDVIQASIGKEVRLIRVEDVLYFEADARYTRVVWRSDGAPGQPPQDAEALIRTPLKELLVQLDARHFRQVHRSVIVAQRHIEAAVRVDEHNMYLRLRGRIDKLPVSRHFQAFFKGQ